uniref:ESPR-type extended signal peptide-containing protein n=1 Tax=Enterobacter ludwigii TaxID=299767 RepID=UPI003F70C192
MNKIYRLIWDSSRQMLIPVSELSASHGKKNVTGSVENQPRFIFRLKAIVIALAAWQGGLYAPAANAFIADGGDYCKAADVAAKTCVLDATTPPAASIAIATGAKASNNAIALGVNSLAGETGTIAIGKSASAKGQYSTAIGQNTQALGTRSIVIGAGNDGETVKGSTVSTDAGISIGYINTISRSGGTYDSNMIAVGNKNELTANGRAMVFGSWNTITDSSPSMSKYDPGTLIMGLDNEVVQSHGAYLFGGSSDVKNSTNSVAIGQYGNVSDSNNAILIGSGTFNPSTDSVPVANTISNSSGSILIGLAGKINGAPSAAILGNNGSVTAANGFVVGNNGSVSASSGLALGNNTTVSHNNAVAIGSNSVTAVQNNTASATIAGKTYQFAGGTANSTVSIGSNTIKRTLTNLAAGQVTNASTDAVNGSQLYATNSAVNVLANDALLWDSSKNAYSATHGTATTNKITNVAAGTLSSSSTDTVNGSQLYATNQNVATNTASITKN